MANQGKFQVYSPQIPQPFQNQAGASPFFDLPISNLHFQNRLKAISNPY